MSEEKEKVVAMSQQKLGYNVVSFGICGTSGMAILASSEQHEQDIVDVLDKNNIVSDKNARGNAKFAEDNNIIPITIDTTYIDYDSEKGSYWDKAKELFDVQEVSNVRDAKEALAEILAEKRSTRDTVAEKEEVDKVGLKVKKGGREYL